MEVIFPKGRWVKDTPTHYYALPICYVLFWFMFQIRGSISFSSTTAFVLWNIRHAIRNVSSLHQCDRLTFSMVVAVCLTLRSWNQRKHIYVVLPCMGIPNCHVHVVLSISLIINDYNKRECVQRLVVFKCKVR